MFIPIPRSIRKLLAILRGGVSPVIIFLSMMIGFTFGLIPEWSGVHIAAIILVVLLNIHLAVFLMSAALGKALCYAAAPALYHVGVAVQEHVPALTKALAQVPIVAITDFSQYAVTGAVVIGPVVGAIGGLMLAQAVIGFRKGMLRLEEKSDKFAKWYSKTWVRVIDRIIIGKRTKDAKSLFSKKAKIVRKGGVFLAIVIVAGFFFVSSLIKDEKVRSYATTQLTKANGAEVNVEALQLSVTSGNAKLSGLQVTDRKNPANNQFAVDNITADASVYDLSVGKVVVDEMVVSNVRFNQPRQSPGKVIEKPVEEPNVFDPCDFEVSPEDIGKIEKYIENAKAVKRWLEKVRKWLPEPEKKVKEQKPVKYLDYLLARSNEPASPRLLAKNVLMQKVQIPAEVFGDSDITAKNLNDSPQVARLPITFDIKSNDTGMQARITFDYSKPGSEPKVSGTFEGLDLSKLQSGLSKSAGLVFKSGKASGTFEGILTARRIDLTVHVDVNDMQASAAGNGILGMGGETTAEALKVLENMKTTLRIVGPTTDPRLAFNVDGLKGDFQDALVKAGKDRLASELGKQLDGTIGDKLGDSLKDKLGDSASEDLKNKIKENLDSDKIMEGLGGLLGGKKEQ